MLSDGGAARPKLDTDLPIADRALVERGVSVLSHKPSAIVTDIDGTISPIAATPAAAVVMPQAREALQLLAREHEVVAIVTGRTSEDAERLLGLPNILYVGNHGLERRWQGETRDHSSAIESMAAIEIALAEVERKLALQDLSEGVLIENKRLSASIHFRLSPRRDEIGPRIGIIVAASATANGLRMTEGRYVYELRPPLTVNKGTAVLDLIEDNNLNGIVFLGDDVTDVDAFREIRKASRNGLVEGLVIAVNSPEVRPVVLEEADVIVDGVSGAVAVLVALASRLRTSPNAYGVE